MGFLDDYVGVGGVAKEQWREHLDKLKAAGRPAVHMELNNVKRMLEEKGRSITEHSLLMAYSDELVDLDIALASSPHEPGRYKWNVGLGTVEPTHLAFSNLEAEQLKESLELAGEDVHGIKVASIEALHQILTELLPCDDDEDADINDLNIYYRVPTKEIRQRMRGKWITIGIIAGDIPLDEVVKHNQKVGEAMLKDCSDLDEMKKAVFGGHEEE